MKEKGSVSGKVEEQWAVPEAEAWAAGGTTQHNTPPPPALPLLLPWVLLRFHDHDDDAARCWPLSRTHSRRLGNANELAPDAMDLIGTARLWSLSSQPLRI